MSIVMNIIKALILIIDLHCNHTVEAELVYSHSCVQIGVYVDMLLFEYII